MSKLILRLVINAAALWAAARYVDGIGLTSDLVGVFIVALIFGVINAIIKPVLTFLSFPFIFVTLGLFTIVVNAAMLYLTAGLTDLLYVNSFGSAIWGSIIISLVSWVLSILVDDKKRKAKRG